MSAREIIPLKLTVEGWPDKSTALVVVVLVVLLVVPTGILEDLNPLSGLDLELEFDLFLALFLFLLLLLSLPLPC